MAPNAPPVLIKRVYEAPDPGDGIRILVDRLWPRGVSKANANVDRWAGQLAPSAELRKWFHHEPSRFDEFRSRYWKELEAMAGIVGRLFADAGEKQITLLYAARDTNCNHAVVLRDFMSQL